MALMPHSTLPQVQYIETMRPGSKRVIYARSNAALANQSVSTHSLNIRFANRILQALLFTTGL